MDAEMVRDGVLAVSGLLVPKLGGPSLKPYQPPGYWAQLNFPKREWEHDHGDALYRRTLYTFWCRSFLHPTLVALDAPSRQCRSWLARLVLLDLDPEVPALTGPFLFEHQANIVGGLDGIPRGQPQSRCQVAASLEDVPVSHDAIELNPNHTTRPRAQQARADGQSCAAFVTVPLALDAVISYVPASARVTATMLSAALVGLRQSLVVEPPLVSRLRITHRQRLELHAAAHSHCLIGERDGEHWRPRAKRLEEVDRLVRAFAEGHKAGAVAQERQPLASRFGGGPDDLDDRRRSRQGRSNRLAIAAGPQHGIPLTAQGDLRAVGRDVPARRAIQPDGGHVTEAAGSHHSSRH